MNRYVFSVDRFLLGLEMLDRISQVTNTGAQNTKPRVVMAADSIQELIC
jgi:hypothetical protein